MLKHACSSRARLYITLHLELDCYCRLGCRCQCKVLVMDVVSAADASERNHYSIKPSCQSPCWGVRKQIKLLRPNYAFQHCIWISDLASSNYKEHMPQVPCTKSVWDGQKSWYLSTEWSITSGVEKRHQLSPSGTLYEHRKYTLTDNYHYLREEGGERKVAGNQA